MNTIVKYINSQSLRNIPSWGGERSFGAWNIRRCHRNTGCVCWIGSRLIIRDPKAPNCICIRRRIPTASPTQALILWRVVMATEHQRQIRWNSGTIVCHSLPWNTKNISIPFSILKFTFNFWLQYIDCVSKLSRAEKHLIDNDYS